MSACSRQSAQPRRMQICSLLTCFIQAVKLLLPFQSTFQHKVILLNLLRKSLLFADAPLEKFGKQYLHEIVANGRNGLDVDKFDYLQRDAHCCGVRIAADIDRLRTFSKASRS